MKKFNCLLVGILCIPLISFSQNVGIGTSTPAFPLHVYSNNQDLSLAKFACAGGYGQIAVSNGAVGTSFGVNNSKGYVGTTSNTDFGIYVGSTELIHLRQDYNFVGIGTSNPLSKFHVQTNDPYNYTAIFRNYSGYSTITVDNFNQYLDLGVNPQQAFIATYNNTDFVIKTAGVNRLFIDKTTAFMGIGTSAPATTFHVVSASPTDQIARFDATGNSNGYIKVGTDNNTVDLGTDYWKSYLSTTGTQDLVMKLNGIERLHIKSSNGNVGIGTETPSTKLHVVGNSYLAGTLITVLDATMLANLAVNGNVTVGTNLAVNGNLTAATNLSVNGNLTVGAIVQPDRTPVTWFSANFHNLGAPYEDVTYYKDKENRVHLSGIVEIVGTQTGTIFILPTGCRPLGNQVFAQMTSSGSINRINVLSSGNVTIEGTLSGWVSMDGISFRAGN